MVDIIEFALEHDTDFRKFEQLSIEVLKLNGYKPVKAVGGIDDEGIDALLVKYFQDETKTTVFQITLQDNINSKITDTIDKLIENKIDFNELVLVTSNQINNTQAIKTKIRKKYDGKVKLEIVERTTFIATLSTENAIFLRYYGDLKQQLTSSLFEKKTMFTENSKDSLTNSLLKCSLLFTFNEHSSHTRKALFDKTVLGILVDCKNANAAEIAEIFKTKFFKIVPIEQIHPSLDRLKKDGLINKTDGNNYEPSKASITKIESAVSKMEQGTKALINDIVLNALSIYPDKVDKDTLHLIEQNIKNGLGLFFRLHGLEFDNEAANPIFKSFGYSISKNADITSIVKKDLSIPLAEAVVYSLGEIINRPTAQQIEILAEWSKAFIGVQVMSLDPSLKEFQRTNLSKKTFLLDTDFLLYCLVKETKISLIYKSLVKELIGSGCEVIISEDVIFEAIKHAEFAERSYNYFKNAFDVVDEIVIEEKIANVFVKGYYTAVKSGAINPTVSFKTYLSNYYEPSNLYDFMCEVIHTEINSSIVIRKIEDMDTSSIPTDVIEKLSQEIYTETIKTAKAQYRTEEENKSIAYTDAMQYLKVLYLNKLDSSKKEISILPGDFYLVTSSIRTLRCAIRIGIRQNITVNPAALLNIFEQIGVFTVSAKEIVNLFDNPFLVEVVNQNWDDVKKLVNAGVDLKAKNIVRLKQDLKEAIHYRLSADNIKDATVVAENGDMSKEGSEVELDAYVAFAQIVKSKGYHFTPEIETLMGKFRQMEEDNNLKDEIIESLKTQAGVHVKKTQHYLDKLAKKAKK